MQCIGCFDSKFQVARFCLWDPQELLCVRMCRDGMLLGGAAVTQLLQPNVWDVRRWLRLTGNAYGKHWLLYDKLLSL